MRAVRVTAPAPGIAPTGSRGWWQNGEAAISHEGGGDGNGWPASRIHDRRASHLRVPIDPLSVAIGAAMGLAGGRTATALAPAAALPRRGAWIAGALGGLAASALLSILGGAPSRIPATAQSAGIDLATTLGNAALGAFGGIALALVAGACLRARIRR